MPAPKKKKTLKTAIEIAAASKALLLHVQNSECPDVTTDDQEFIGASLFAASMRISPMLLALSMELALKAWIAFDFRDQDIPKEHDLIKLFSCLSPSARERLKSRYDEEILPHRGSLFYTDDGLERVLANARNAFTEWRYVHELDRAHFESGGFEETIEMVLSEFERCFVVRKYPPLFSGGF